MIRRLQQETLLESIVPRSIAQEQTLPPVLDDDTSPTNELDTQAYRDGYAEGFQAGEEDGRREAAQFHRAWEEQTRTRMEEEHRALIQEREKLEVLMASLDDQLRFHRDAMEELAFDLALKGIAVAFGSAQADGEWIRRLCAQMVEEYRGRSSSLEVSAIDRDYFPEYIEGMPISVEHSLLPGQCRIVTGRGYAESSIKGRLESIYSAMIETLDAIRS